MKIIFGNTHFNDTLKNIIRTGKLVNCGGYLDESQQMEASKDLINEESDTIKEMFVKTRGSK